MSTVKDIITASLEECRKSILANLVTAGKVASGRTGKSLKVEGVSIAGGKLTGWEFYQVWETGRKPGKRPPIKPILEWVLIRVTSDPVQARNIAYAIATKIGREGTKLYRQGGRKDIYTPPFEKLENDLPDQLGDFMVDIIINKIETK